MKKFAFPLERVMQWREKQVALEESRLEVLHGEARALKSRRNALDTEQARLDQAVVSATLVEASQLAALDSFRKYARVQRQVLDGQAVHLGHKIEAQRQALVEARRKFELLNRLRDKSLTEWRINLQREIDEAAAEAYLSRLCRDASDADIPAPPEDRPH